jgi:hypothetical protein
VGLCSDAHIAVCVGVSTIHLAGFDPTSLPCVYVLNLLGKALSGSLVRQRER